MKHKENSGIYKIINLKTNKFYIGSSVDLETRKSVHFHNLRENKHHSRYLQNSFNKHGEKNFKFEIIEFVDDREKLITREQYWMDFFNVAKGGYNLSPTAGGNKGIVYTEEMRRNISESLKGKMVGEKNPFYGKKHSEETKEKFKNRNYENIKGENNINSKLTTEIVKKIREEYKNTNITQKQLAKKYNIKKETISLVIRNKSWHNPDYIYEPKKQSEYNTRKYTKEIVFNIRYDHEFNNLGSHKLAHKYNIKRGTIQQIINYETWKDVKLQQLPQQPKEKPMQNNKYLTSQDITKEYSEKDFKICKICNKEYKNKTGLCTHIASSHKIKIEDYIIKYFFNDERHNCPVCNEKTRFVKECWAFKKYCGKHANESRREYNKIHGMSFDPGWKKGLTKENHEGIKKHSEKMKGENNVWYGKKLPKEIIEKANITRKISEEEFHKRINEKAQDKFVLLSSYKDYKKRIETYLKFKCVHCDKNFERTLALIENGYGCCHCSSKKS